MKILIVSGFFFPQNTPRAFRTTELAKEFARLGHSVKVYFPESDYDYSDFKKSNPKIEISFIPAIGGNPAKLIKELDKERFVPTKYEEEYYGFVPKEEFEAFAKKHLKNNRYFERMVKA